MRRQKGATNTPREQPAKSLVIKRSPAVYSSVIKTKRDNKRSKGSILSDLHLAVCVVFTSAAL